MDIFTYFDNYKNDLIGSHLQNLAHPEIILTSKEPHNRLPTPDPHPLIFLPSSFLTSYASPPSHSMISIS